jgi:hypothetical protein
MANGAFKFKDNSGNIVASIGSNGSNIVITGGTLDLSGMSGLTLGSVTLSGTTQNATSASHAASYLLTSSFNTYSGTTNTIIGTLQTSTGSLNSFTSSTNSRLNSIEGVSGSYATTGSNQFKSDQVITGSLTVTGFIDAQELRTTYISSSILYRSGSTKFGDELSDTHAFTGSMLISGSVTTTGNVGIGGQIVLNTSNNQIRSGNELRFYRPDNAIYTQLYDGGGANGFVIDNRNGDGFSLQSVGTNQLRISSTGDATFSSSVTASGAISTSGTGLNASVRINNTTASTGVDWHLYSLNNGNFGLYNNTGGTYALQISSSGNVGIGTNNPGQKLEVVGGEIKAGRVDSNEEGGQVSFGRASDNATGWYIDSYGSTSTPALRFVDVSNSAIRMTITSGGVVRIANLTSNGLVGTDSSGNLGVVNSTYTEIATGTITYSMTAGSPWAINNSFPATIRDFNDDAMIGSGDDQPGSNQNRGVTFDLGSAKAVRKIVERGYNTKNLNSIVVQYSTDNSNWTNIHTYRHVYGNTQKNMEFNPTGAIAARYWRWFIDSWTEREVQNYYTYESIIYT